MAVVVRNAEMNDIAAIMKIARTDVDHLGFEPRGAYEQSVTDKKLLVAILDEKYLIGFVKFGGTTKDKWTIYQIATARIARGHGAGKALLRELSAQAAQFGKGIRLKVTTENTTAVNFYTRNGFVIKSTEKPSKRWLYLMEKEVDDTLTN